MRLSSLWVVLGVLGSVLGCEEPKETSAEPPAKTRPSTGGAFTPKSSATAGSVATAGAQPPRAEVKFVRRRPSEQPTGVDACAYLGWTGMACLEALTAETNPVVRRYLRRLSDADARLASDAFDAGERQGMAHAEVALSCGSSGPCGKGEGITDDGYACLTKAEIALREDDRVTMNEAHARACTCDPKRAQIPVMGGYLACDGARAVTRAEILPTAVAKDVRACGECDPATGPAACAREIERLRGSDKQIADYLDTVHVPRCAQP